MRRSGGILSLLLVAISADALPQSAVSNSIDTKGKFPVIRVTGMPPIWRLDSIGTLADSGDVGFTRIMSLLIDPRGGVLVMPAKPPAIVRYSDQGKLLAVIGRAGAGPREYQRPVGGGWVDNDLIVYDPGNGRVVRWNRAGDWVAQWLAARGCCDSRMVLPAGPSHVWTYTARLGPNKTASRGFLRLPATGRDDTIWAPPRPPLVPVGLECPWGSGNIELFSYPFASPVYSLQPTAMANFVEVSGLDYRVAIKSKSGDTLRVLEHVTAPVPISDREWRDSTAEYRDFMSKHSGVSCNRGMDRPRAKAVVHDMQLDERGRIWVERNVASGTEWDIWDGDKLVGTARGGPRVYWSPIDIRADRMVVTRTSDDGGVVAVVYRIVEHR